MFNIIRDIINIGDNMEITSFVKQLKIKYDYSEEMEQFLLKAIPSIIKYYGEDKKNIIFGALNDCEIHIQKEKENRVEYLNNYFKTNKKWDIPFLASAFQHTELSVKDNKVSSKSIIYIKNEYCRNYVPFDFNDDSKISGIIHEICHAIKEYGKLKVENGQVIIKNGIITNRYIYNPGTNSFEEPVSINTGLEEAINSYDEASIMTIMTGVFHEYGAYKGMTHAIRLLFQNKDLADIFKISQFSGGNEWIDFLGKENSEILSKNFEDWISVFYSPPNEIDALMEKKEKATKNLLNFINSYSTLSKQNASLEVKKIKCQELLELVNYVITYNANTNLFEDNSISENSIKM